MARDEQLINSYGALNVERATPFLSGSSKLATNRSTIAVTHGSKFCGKIFAGKIFLWSEPNYAFFPHGILSSSITDSVLLENITALKNSQQGLSQIFA